MVAHFKNFESENKEGATKVYDAQTQLRGLASIVAAFDSNDSVGQTTFGAIVGSLMSDPGFANDLRSLIVKAETNYFGTDRGALIPSETATPEEFMAYLQERASAYEATYNAILDANVPDAGLRSFVTRQSDDSTIYELSRSYVDTQTASIRLLKSESAQLGGAMVRLVKTLPRNSQEYHDIAQMLNEFRFPDKPNKQNE
jgi:hypothetical protein